MGRLFVAMRSCYPQLLALQSPSLPCSQRRSNSASTRSAVNAASAAALPANTHDENTLPSGVEVADQSAVMAGKVVGAQRRSALSAVSVNAASATVNALVITRENCFRCANFHSFPF